MEELKFVLYNFMFILKFSSALPNQVCTSKECHQQSSTILENLDASVSPCDDFYQFACGNFKFNGGQFSPQQDQIDNQLTAVFSEKLSKKDDEILKLVKTFYKSCINNHNSIDDTIKGKLTSSIDNSDVQHDEAISWESFIQNLQFFQYQNAYIFQLDFDFIGDEFLIVVDRPKFRTYKIDNSKIDFVVSLGFDRGVIELIAKQAAELIGKFSGVLSFKNTEKLSTVKEFQEIFTFFDFSKFLNGLFQGKNFPEKILIRNLQVLKEINKILLKSSNEVIRSYIKWLYIDSIFNQWHNDEEYRMTKTENKSVSKTCYSSTINNLSMAVAAVYIRKFSNEQTNTELTNMIERIKQNLLESFQNNDWLDDVTKMNALEKLRKLKFVVAYPKLLKNKVAVEQFYDGLELDEKNFVKNLESIYEFDLENILHFATEDTDFEENIAYNFANRVFRVNAGYYQGMNAFFIFNGILYNLTFSTSRPTSMNYGSIGSVIAHEILHGFDSNGRHFDSDGNLVNWWTKEAEEAFLKKAQCLVDQYGNYTEPVTNLKVNGTLTLGENIADNGGFVTAYNSYQNWVKTNKFDQNLPNLNFTPNQLFWISNAHFFCSNYNYEESVWAIKYDPHSPDRFRVNGAMGNSEEFLKDFQCSEHSVMNRKNKCKVW